MADAKDWVSQNLSFDEVMALIDNQIKEQEEQKNSWGAVNWQVGHQNHSGAADWYANARYFNQSV